MGYLFFIVLFLGLPVCLTIANCFFLLDKKYRSRLYRFEALIESLTLVCGVLFSFLLLLFLDVTTAEWTEILTNSQRHTPISTEGLFTVMIIFFVGLIGYLMLRLGEVTTMPPLLIVCAISFVYLGIALAIVWMVQVSAEFFLMLFPFNCILLALKAIKNNLRFWQEQQLSGNVRQPKKNLSNISQLLMNSRNWFWLAFIVMLPVLGILLIILLLFGQRPDAFIQAWTQTSDWRLSQQIAPPNISYDEHYLCTVAASGHRWLVRPQRMGIRHGHRVVVNRQLCIANAFEQILEEKIPRTHHFIRENYDRYGYPLARKIKSAYTADVIYVVMKPVELFFLAVIYLTDCQPENRIALQYLPKPKPVEEL